MKRTRITALGLLATALALTGCGSDGPSSSEAKAAIQSQMNQEMAAITKLAGKSAGETMRSMVPDFEVEVLSCEKEGAVSRCVLEVEATVMGQQMRETKPVAFTKGSDGNWVAMK